MTRLAALCFVGAAVCAGLILIEFGSDTNNSPTFVARLPPAQKKSDAPEIRRLADPPLRLSLRSPEASSAADDTDSSLRDLRLTGVVIEPDRRIAIFAVSGSKALALSEGEALKDWRLDSILPEKVLLSGPAGTITLEPKPDPNLIRPSPPVAVEPGRVESGMAPDATLVGELGQPMAAIPIAVATPAPAQGYPYYFPDYYAGYDQYYPSYSYSEYPYPYFAYAIPVRGRFGFGVLHHHDIHHGGFLRGVFHGGAHGGHR
jgi:hypothetical protein